MKLLRKLNDPPPAAIVNAGEISSVLPTAAGSGANALFGAVSDVVVDVTQATSAPVAALVHPVGSAGAVTPSKFSLQPPPGVGVAVGVPVAVAVAVAVGVAVGVAVAVAVGVAVGVGVVQPVPANVTLSMPMKSEFVPLGPPFGTL